jgi:Flp pilus assembly protein TadG
MQMNQNRARRGNSMIEFVLIAPWFFFLFTGLLNAGIATYGLIAVQNAARVAAVHTSENTTTASDQAGACALVVAQLKGLPFMGSDFSGSCTGQPLTVTATYCDGTTPCFGSSMSVDGGPATFVRVTYSLPPLFQFPISSMATISRTAEMRLRDPLP